MSQINRLLVYAIVLAICSPVRIICSEETEWCMEIEVKIQYLRQAMRRSYGKTIESSFSSEFNTKINKKDQSGSLGVGLDGLIPEIGAQFSQSYGNSAKRQSAQCSYWENDIVFQSNTMQLYEETTYRYMVDGVSLSTTTLEYVDTEINSKCDNKKKLSELAASEINRRFDNCTTPTTYNAYNQYVKSSSCQPANIFKAEVCTVSGKYQWYNPTIGYLIQRIIHLIYNINK